MASGYQTSTDAMDVIRNMKKYKIIKKYTIHCNKKIAEGEKTC